MLHQRREGLKLGESPSDVRDQVRSQKGLIESHLPAGGVLLHPVDGGQADASSWHVDDPAHRQVVLGVVHRLQVSQQVLDLPAGVEINAAYDLIGDAGRHKLLFKHPGLGVGAVQDGIVAVVTLPCRYLAADVVHHILRLIVGGVKLAELNGLSFSIFRPKGLVLPPFIVADHAICRLKDGLRGAVVLLQLDHPGVWKYFLEVQDILDVGSPELVDGLVVVPHHAQVPVLARQQPHQLKLHCVGVLVLIHHDIAEPLLVVVQHLLLGLEQLHRLQQQIVKIQGVVGPQLPLILAVDFCHLLPAKISSRLKHQLLRRHQFIFGLGNGGQ